VSADPSDLADRLGRGCAPVFWALTSVVFVMVVVGGAWEYLTR
jgi:hypothetical protein